MRHILLILLHRISICIRSLSNFLKEKRFDNHKHLNSDIEFFFSSKSPDFYARGILQLPDRWATVVDSGGDYIID